jgi:hypothetical protein
VRQTLSFCSTPRTLRPRDCSAGPVTHSSPAFLGWPQDASHCQKQNPTETVLWGKLSIISEGDKGDAQGPPLPQLPVRGQWRVGLLTDQLAQAKEMLGTEPSCEPARLHLSPHTGITAKQHLPAWPAQSIWRCGLGRVNAAVTLSSALISQVYLVTPEAHAGPEFGSAVLPVDGISLWLFLCWRKLNGLVSIQVMNWSSRGIWHQGPCWTKVQYQKLPWPDAN